MCALSSRVLVVLIVLAVTAPAHAQNIYTWTLSNSSEDPFSNRAPTPTNSLLELYLWLACASADGAIAAEFDMEAPPGCAVLAFSPAAPWMNAGVAPTELLLSSTCQPGGAVVGLFLTLDLTGGDYCLVPSAAGVNATVDCTTFSAWDNYWIGFNNTNQTPCQVTIECPPLAVDDFSWGRVKGLYR